MNDPRSSRGREGDAKRDLPPPSDLGYRHGEGKDLEEVSRGQQNISRNISPAIHVRPPGAVCSQCTCTSSRQRKHCSLPSHEPQTQFLLQHMGIEDRHL